MRQSILMHIMIFMTRFYHNFYSFFRFNSVSKRFFLILRTAFIVMSFLFVISCEEGPAKIGSELLPSNDYVTVSSTDTLSVWSYTLYNNSVPTNDPSVAFIGDVYDPYFGTTTTEFISQLRLGGPWKYGPVTIDSVKMTLRLLTVKGGSTSEIHYLKMSEIADQIYTDTLYYSDTQPTTTGFETTIQLPELTPDTINTLSVSLPVEFGEYLIRDTTHFFYSNTKPDFRSWFKGLYFQLTPSADPLIFTFSLVNQSASGGAYNNYFVLFMHDTADVKIRYYFILDPRHPNAGYNKLERDFSTADPDKKIQHINDYTYRDTLSYLQALNGVYTKIVFPGLDSLKEEFSKSRFSINKARITIPAYYDGDQFTVSTVPPKLSLRYTDKNGEKQYVPDFEIDVNNKFFDGTLHKTDSTYYFNIPTYIQNYLEDKNNEYLPELDVYLGQSGLNSVILKANSNTARVKFEMTYTKF